MKARINTKRGVFIPPRLPGAEGTSHDSHSISGHARTHRRRGLHATRRRRRRRGERSPRWVRCNFFGVGTHQTQHHAPLLMWTETHVASARSSCNGNGGGGRQYVREASLGWWVCRHIIIAFIWSAAQSTFSPLCTSGCDSAVSSSLIHPWVLNLACAVCVYVCVCVCAWRGSWAPWRLSHLACVTIAPLYLLVADLSINSLEESHCNYNG